MERIYAIMTFLLLSLVSCEKDTETGLEIYLLTDYQKKTPGYEIIPGSEKLTRNPAISYSDILMYDSTYHEFEINPVIAQEFNLKKWSVQGTAFALTINKSIIYTGYFMPGYSSLGIDWIAIDPLSVDSKIRVTLGYPGEQAALANRDPRNDTRIINLLQKDRKLRQ